jgi:hypothetical protein
MINYTPPTQHTSLFYRSAEEYLEIIIPYIKAGLDNNEFCFWNIPYTLTVNAAREHLAQSVENLDSYFRKEQIEILDYKTFYLQDGVFSAARTVEKYAALEDKVLARGFKGVRAIGDGSWAVKDDNNWFSILMYEKEINQIIHLHKIRAICSYCIENLELKDICSIGSSHQSSLVKQMGNWNRLDSDKFTQSSTY